MDIMMKMRMGHVFGGFHWPIGANVRRNAVDVGKGGGGGNANGRKCQMTGRNVPLNVKGKLIFVLIHFHS